MSAERGWIGQPQPVKEWHTPGWLREKGGPSHFHSHLRPGPHMADQIRDQEEQRRRAEEEFNNGATRPLQSPNSEPK